MQESYFVDVINDEFDEFQDMSDKRRSEVWKHFLQSSTRKEYVKCRHCDKIMVQATGNNTSALMKFDFPSPLSSIIQMQFYAALNTVFKNLKS